MVFSTKSLVVVANPVPKFRGAMLRQTEQAVELLRHKESHCEALFGTSTYWRP